MFSFLFKRRYLPGAIARHRRRGALSTHPNPGLLWPPNYLGRRGLAGGGRGGQVDGIRGHFSLYLLLENQPAWITFSILGQLETPCSHLCFRQLILPPRVLSGSHQGPHGATVASSPSLGGLSSAVPLQGGATLAGASHFSRSSSVLSS